MQFDTVSVEVDAFVGHGGAGEAAGATAADAEMVLVGGEGPCCVSGLVENIWICESAGGGSEEGEECQGSGEMHRDEVGVVLP